MNKDPYEATHDFGFTFEEPSDNLVHELSDANEKLALAGTALYNIQSMITPLLDNLMKEPNKATLKWPNRAEKVKEFKDTLDSTIKDIMEILNEPSK